METSRITTVACIAIGIAVGAGAARAQGRLEPGEWEATSSTEIPGTYTGPIERTDRRCYTTSDQKLYADKDAWAKDMVEATGAGCTAKDLKQEGTALSVTLVCDEGMRQILMHDFRGAAGTMETQIFRGDELGTKSRYTLKRVAERCSPETIEQWKAWHPGQDYAP
jgi:hypothetical protein